MTKGSILIIDDDREMRVSLTHLLETADFEVSSAKDGQEALSTLTERQRDAVLCDVRMPGMSGLEFLSKARDVSAAPIILISAHGDIPMAVDAIQGGAYSFLEKPFDPRRLLTILSNAVRMRQLENRANELQEKLTRLTDLSQVLIGDSPEINTVRSLVFDYADVPANVLIRGRTGTGKELVARALHDLGAGPEKPFIAVNCAAIPPDGFEQHVIGGGDGPSLLEKAHGGTLFLDELTSMPLETQSKFLRAIETETQDIRIISAASQDLEASVANGSLREDLLFRLNTLVIEIPDLRERGDDILLLYRHYLGRIAALYDLPLPETTNDDYAALIAHDWPGNVRELQNVVERRVLAERRGVGSVRQALIGIPTTQTMPDTLREAVAVFEKEIISQAIVIAQGRMDDAAAHLGIGRRTLNEKVSKLAIDKSKLLNS